jgi:hypothetical protein
MRELLPTSTFLQMTRMTPVFGFYSITPRGMADEKSSN